MQKKNQNTPEISVILPVYNCGFYVRDSIESILNQTYKNFELIIINDGSTDGGVEIIRELANKDPRIILIERENKGLIYSLNEGISRSRGSILARMDADDIAMPDRFKLQYSHMQSDLSLAVLGTAVRTINSDGKSLGFYCHLITPRQIKKFCEEDCPVIHPTVMMRKDVVQKIGGYRSSYQHCEDYDLWLRIIDAGYNVANIPVPLLNYRVHQTNISKIYINTQRFNAVVARLSHRVRQAGLPDPTSNVEKFDESIIKSFPEDVLKNINEILFVANNSDISSKDASNIYNAWGQYKELKNRKLAKAELSNFLMRLLFGAIKNNQYNLAGRILLSAIGFAPSQMMMLIIRKMEIILRVRMAMVLGSGDASIS